MESLEEFQRNRRVIEEFSRNTLAAIPTDYGRLRYIALLRDLATGQYRELDLESVHPREVVQQVLRQCHEELFIRILETPLEQQEWDLRTCLGSLEGNFWTIVSRWQEAEYFRILVPTGVPSYLHDLFCSNVCALLGIFAQQRSSASLNS